MLRKLAPRNIGRKGPCIDRHTQLTKEMPNSANVIFMRVSDKYRLELVFAVRDPSQVREDEVDPGARIHIRECHAQIDKNKPLLVFRPIAVDVTVHSDLACPAKGKVD